MDAVNQPFQIQLPSMEMPRYGFVLLATLLGIAGLAASWCRASYSMHANKKKHSFWDYLLLWPLILKRDSTAHGSTARVLVGWGIVIILVIAAIVFRW